MYLNLLLRIEKTKEQFVAGIRHLDVVEVSK